MSAGSVKRACFGRRAGRTVLLHLALLCQAVVPAHAQERVVHPGDRLRVSALTLGSSPLIGTVEAISSQLLVLRADQDRSHVHLPLGSISAVEISEGIHSRAKRGAVLGFAVGAVVGYFAAACDPSDPECWDDMELVAIPVVGAAGALLGLAVGKGLRSERWAPLPPSALGTRGRAGLGMHLRLGSLRFPR